jgi:hypothetical protein
MADENLRVAVECESSSHPGAPRWRYVIMTADGKPRRASNYKYVTEEDARKAGQLEVDTHWGNHQSDNV